MLATASSVSAGTVSVLVDKAPSVNGGTVTGDLWQLSGQGGNINSGFTLNGDWLFPGTPNFNFNGAPDYSGVEAGDGSSSPSGYWWTINSGVMLGYLRTQIDPTSLLAASSAQSPTGSRTAHLNSSSDSPGDFATLRNLTIQNQVGEVSIPPGAYGDFTINQPNSIVLGEAGAAESSVYHFQRINLNSGTSIQLVGPVEIRLKNSLHANGTIGNPSHPEWLTLHMPNGDFTLNSGSRLDGLVIAPNGRVTVNGNTVLNGGSSSKYFTLNSGGQVIGRDLVFPDSGGNQNQPPSATAASFSIDEDTILQANLSGNDPDGDPLTFALVQEPVNGVLSLISDGTFSYTPNTDFHGNDSFSFTVSDESETSAAAIVSLSIAPVNDAPTAAVEAFSVLEDIATSLNISATDLDGDTLAASILSASGGKLTGDLTNGFVFTPTANFNGPASFSLRVIDGKGGEALVDESFSIIPVNDAPEFTSPAITAVREDELYVYTVTTLDVDTGDVVTVTADTLPAWLSFDSVTLAGTPTNAEVGVHTVVLTATDLAGDFVTQSFTISVNNVNDAPVATAASFSTDEDMALTGQLSGADDDGDSLSFALGINASNGAVTLNADGSFSYAPNENYNGSDSFTFTVYDGALTSATATVSLTIAPVNDVPVAAALNIGTNEDSPVDVLLSASDIDGDLLSFTVIDSPSNGTLSGVAPDLVYMPNSNYNGSDSFTYRVNDGQLDSAPVTVALTVNAINDAPKITSVAITSVNEDELYSYTVTISDVDTGDLVTVVADTLPAWLSFDGATLAGTPVNAEVGAHNVVLTATDLAGASDSQTFTITVSNVNDAPVAVAASFATDEDTTLSSQLTGSDEDSDALTFSVETLPGNGVLSLNADGSFSYTPNANYNGSDSFTFDVNDGVATSVAATVDITVNSINDAPIAISSSFTTQEDTELTSSLAGTDVDGDDLSFEIAEVPTQGSLVLNSDGSFSYTPGANYHGVDSFSFTVSDGSLSSEVAVVSLGISPVNDLPVADILPFIVEEDTATAIMISASDADSDSLSASIISFSGGLLSGDLSNGFIFNPDENYFGPASFVVEINDGNGGVATLSENFTINAVNDTPIANVDSAVTDEDIAVAITLSGLDIDGDALTFAIVDAPSNGTLSGILPNMTYTPAENFNGSDSFTFSVNDGVETSDPAIVSITVNPVNDAPFFTSTAVTNVDEDVAYTYLITAEDVDAGDVVTINADILPVWLNFDGLALSGTPTNAEVGVHDVLLTATDPTGDSVTQGFTVTVNNVNDAPVAAAASFATAEDITLTDQLAGSDDDGDLLSFALVGNASNGSVTVNADGSFTYSPDENYNGPDSFSFTVSDDVLTSAAAMVNLTVTPVNDAPIAAALSLVVDEDSAVDVLLFASDIDGDSLSFTVVDAPVNGTLSGIAPDMTYTPNANYNGSDSFTYRVNDGQLDSALVTATLVVNAVNDAPEITSVAITSINEDELYTYSVTASDVDAGDIVTITADTLPAWLSFDGTILTGMPTNAEVGTHEVVLTATDLAGDAAIQAFTIRVNNVNDTPVAIAASFTTDEDNAFSGQLTGSDDDGDSLTFALMENASDGNVTVNADGSFEYVPNTNFHGADSFSFIVSDGTVISAPAIVSVTIVPVNDAPFGVIADIQVLEDAAQYPIDLYQSFSDEETADSNLSFTLVENTDSSLINPVFSVDAVSGFLVLAFAQNANGNASLTLRVTDDDSSNPLSTELTFAVAVIPVNDGPQIISAAVTTAVEETPYTYQVEVTDPEDSNNGTDLSFALSNTPDGMVISATGLISWTPEEGILSAPDITVSVADGGEDNAQAATQTFSIAVTPVNDPPVASPLPVQMVNEDESIRITFIGSDVDNSVLLPVITSQPSHGSVSPYAGLTWEYQPEAEYSGPDSFTFYLTDGELNSEEITVSLDVLPVNDIPVSVADSVTTAEDQPVDIDVIANDVDVESQATLSIYDYNQAQYGAVSLNGDGTLRYTPNEDFYGDDSFRYRVQDDHDPAAVSLFAVVTVTVTPVNDAPSGVIADVEVDEDSAPFTIDLRAVISDVDDPMDALNFSVIGNTDESLLTASADNLTGILSLVFAPDATGNAQITVRASDGELDYDTSFQVTVFPVSDPPVGTIADVVAAEDQSPTQINLYSAFSDDIDADNVMSYQILSPGDAALIDLQLLTDSSSGDLILQIAYLPDAFGSTSITVSATDSSNLTTEVTFAVTVTSVNDAPVITSSPLLTATEDQTYTYLVTVDDVDDANNGADLNFSLANAPTGMIVSTTGLIEWTPLEGVLSADDVTVTVTDGGEDGALPASQTFSITVTPINDAPVATAVPMQVVAEDDSVVITLTGTDVDSPATTTVIQNAPVNGTLENLGNQQYRYSPNADYYGSDHLAFYVTDGELDSSPETVNILVEPVNDAPVAVADSSTINENASVDLPVLANDSDPDLDPISIDQFTQPANGTVTSVSGGILRYEPDYGFSGTDTFTYTVTDGIISSVPATVSIIVNAVNFTPVAVDDIINVAENGSVTFSPLDNDTDADLEDILTIIDFSQPLYGELTLSSDARSVTYTPNPDFYYEDTFAYTISDNSSLGEKTATAIVKIDVIPDSVNSAPFVVVDENEITVLMSSPAVTLSGFVTDDGLPLNDLSAGWFQFSGPGNVQFSTTESSIPPDSDVSVEATFDTPGDYEIFLYGYDTELYGIEVILIRVEFDNYDPIGAIADINALEDESSVAVDLFASFDDIETADEALLYEVTGNTNDTLVSPVVNISTGELELPLAPNASGVALITVKVTDEKNASVEASFTLTVQAVNDAPTALDDTITVAEAGMVTVDVLANDSDVDSAGFIITGFTSGAYGAVSQTLDNQLTYSHDSSESLSDSFTYSIEDEQGESSTATVVVTITPVNDAPVAVADTLYIEQGGTEPSFNIIANDFDPEGDAFTVAEVSAPTIGSLTDLGNGLVSYTHAGLELEGEFTYTLQDVHGAISTGLVSIRVVDTQPPVAVDDTLDSFEDVATFWDITANDSDPEGAAVAVTDVFNSVNCDVQLNQDGTVTVTPLADYVGVVSFQYRINDGFLNSEPANVTLNLAPVNDAPYFTYATELSVQEDSGPHSFANWANFNPGPTNELTQQPLSYTVTNLSNPTLFAVAPAIALDGSISFEPAADAFGECLVSVVVRDDGGTDNGGVDASDAVTFLITVYPEARGRTYTTSADFEEGDLLALLTNVPGELYGKNDISVFNYIWVAKTDKGTVVRIDINTGEILGEYRTAPEGQPLSPSRTTVDARGGVWVGNRGGNGVVHVISPLDPNIIDRNGDGLLNTSTGLGDILPWPNTNNADATGGVSTAEDELIQHYVKVNSSGIRHVSVNNDNNVWVSGTSGRRFDLIDGETGEIIRSEGSVGRGGYGGLVTPDDVLWSTRPILRWDTTQPLAGPEGGSWRTYPFDSYGSGIDSQGNVWISQYGGGVVRKFDPNGDPIGVYSHGNRGRARGVAADFNDHIWVAHSDGGTVGHLLNDGTFIGNVSCGRGPAGVALDANGKIWVTNRSGGTLTRINPNIGPIGADGVTPIGVVELTTRHLGSNNLYTYSDMTGSTLQSFNQVRRWSTVYDSSIPNADWGPLQWTADFCGASGLEIMVELSDDGDNFTPPEPITASDPTPSAQGRYIRVTVNFVLDDDGVSPRLYDLTVGTVGYGLPTPSVPDWSVGIDAPENLEVEWPNPGIFTGRVCNNGAYTDNDNVTLQWSLLSGPGSATFSDDTAALTEIEFEGPGDYIIELLAVRDSEIRTAQVPIHVIPLNQAPWVEAGDTIYLDAITDLALLEGQVFDDGLPEGVAVTTLWSKKEGPGDVSFVDSASLITEATFSQPGIYVLELTADDTELTFTDTVEIRVAMTCSVIPDESISAWYPANSVASEIIRDNDAISQNDAAYRTGQIGQAFSFDGSNDFFLSYGHPNVDINAFDEGFTVEFWTYLDDGDSSGTFVSWIDQGVEGVSFGRSSYLGRKLWVNLRSPTGEDRFYESSDALYYGSWRHVTITYSRQTGMLRFYLNAQYWNQWEVGDLEMDTQGDLQIGKGDRGYIDGAIDELTFYSRALDPEDIWAIYDASLSGKCLLPGNTPPLVNAGPDLAINSTGQAVTLQGTASDDGEPRTPLKTVWALQSGPGEAVFADTTDPQTEVSFTIEGVYMLKLSASDGEVVASDIMQVQVGQSCMTQTDDSIVAWWTGNESTAELIHDNEAGLSRGTYRDGVVGRSFDFTGSSYVRVEADETLDLNRYAGFTLEFWAQVDEGDDFGTLLAWSPVLGDYGVEVYRSGYLGRRLNINMRSPDGADSIYTTNDTLYYSGWNHYAFTYDRFTGWLRYYKNAQLLHEWQVGDLELDTQGDLFVGYGKSGYFDGSIDELSFYSRALTPEELWDISDAGAIGKCLNFNNQAPVVDAGSDTGIADISTILALKGSVQDDGLPLGNPLDVEWTKTAGPGTVVFSDATDPQSTVTFSAEGTYELTLSAFDGQISIKDTIVVQVAQTCYTGVDPELLAWWPGNQTADDVTGSHPGGMIRSGYRSARVGSGFDFTGSSYMRVPESDELDINQYEGFTIEFWVYADDGDNFGTLFSWADSEGQGLTVYRSNHLGRRINIDLRDADGTERRYRSASDLLTSGNWYHFTYTYDRDTGLLRIYRNAYLYDEWQIGDIAIDTLGELRLGWGSRNGYFDGSLDEVSLYSRALDPEEISEIYASDAIGKCLPIENETPLVYAGIDAAISGTAVSLALEGYVFDDGLPPGNTVQIAWSKLNGPGEVIFVDDADPETSVSFSADGLYELELSAFDGQAISKDVIVVQVGSDCLASENYGLISWWPANQNPNDLFSNNHGGIVRAGYRQGYVGSAFDLSGSGYVRVDDEMELSLNEYDGFTIEFWCYADDGDDFGTLFSWADSDGQGLTVYRSDHLGRRINIDLRGADGTERRYRSSSDLLLYSNWYHFAYTYDRNSGLLRVYRNAYLYDEWQVGDISFDTLGDLRMGWGSRNGYFDGALDEVSFYSRALKPEEVSACYLSGSIGKCLPIGNEAPLVYAGEDTGVSDLTEPLNLDGIVFDDGLPAGNSLQIAWSQLSGPGVATFSDSAQAQTMVSFDAEGLYELELSAYDGQVLSTDVLLVQVASGCETGDIDGLIGWWSANQSDENFASSGDGALVRSGYRVGYVGSAFELSGAGYVRVAENTVLDLNQYDGFTIEFWCYADDGDNFGTLLSWADSEGQGLTIYRSDHLGRRMNIDLRDAIGTERRYRSTSDLFFYSNWYHFTYTYDRNTGLLRIYRNAYLYNEWQIGDINFDALGDLRIGWGSRNGYFDGAIDEVSLFNRALASEEISTIYSAGAKGKCLPQDNESPIVYAGIDKEISVGVPVLLTGQVFDDGLPGDSPLAVRWSKLQGPGNAIFSTPDAFNTEVTFDQTGRYEVELFANDGLAESRDIVEFTVGGACSVIPDSSLLYWLTGNQTTADLVSGDSAGLSRSGYRTGLVGSGFDFSGSGYLRVAERTELDLNQYNGFTIEGWFYADDGDSSGVLLSWADTDGQGLSIFRSDYQGRRININLRDVDGTDRTQKTGDTLYYGNWYHLAFTYERSTGELHVYRGGSLLNNWSVGDIPFDSLGDLRIGWGSQGYFDGSIDELSIYSRALDITEIDAIYQAGWIGKCHPDPANNGPTVTLAGPNNITLPANILDYTVSAFDDGLPADQNLSLQWRQISGPGVITFEPASIAGDNIYNIESITTLTMPAIAGDYTIEVVVSDGMAETVKSQTVTVWPKPNEAPVVAIDNLSITEISVSETLDLTATASDDGFPLGNDLVATWSKFSGPGEVTFSPTVEINPGVAMGTSASFSETGDYRLRLQLSDGQFTTTDYVDISVYQGPEVELTSPIDGYVFRESDTIPLWANAFDPGGQIVSVEYFVDGVSVGQGSLIPNSITYTLDVAANSFGAINQGFSFYAQATDNDGYVTRSKTRTFLVVDGNYPAPDALIESPANDSVITAPTPVIGTVTTELLDSYVLEHRLKGASQWVEFANATVQVPTSAELAVFDPTLLRNGIYDVRLVATDLLGRSITDTIQVVVDSGMKIGHFTLAFEDLNIPVSGIPVQLLRTYDSRGALQGDFGPGWDLGIRTVQVYENRTIGEQWYLDTTSSGLGGRWVFKPLRPVVVSVVLGDDQVEQFEAYTEPQGTILGPEPTAAVLKFRPINGSVGSFTTVDGEIGYSMVDEGGGVYYVDDFGNGPLDPSRYVYTTTDGTKLEIEQILGLRKVTDRNQNILTITEDGITHSSGKSIEFTRDTQGRITQITDPEGNILSYEYDANDRLHKFIDRAGNDPDAPQYRLFTEYRYENANFPNYLTSIIDPRGIEAIASEYDDDGRLVAQKDADGNTIDFIHDIPNRKEYITDRLGVATVHEYDLEGNVVTTTTVDPNNPSGPGLTTTYSYDANRNETRMVDPLGNVTERSYDLATNNLLSETQYISDGAGGQTAVTTTYTYDAFSNPLTIKDAEDNVTTFAYDPATGDLLTQKDAENNLTTFTYDAAGNLETMTDADGNVTTNTYNRFGYVTATEILEADNTLLSSSTFTYDNNGNQTSQSQLRTLYDAQGNVTGTEQVVTSLDYDTENRVIKTTFNDNTFIETVYNDFGQVAIQRDQESEETQIFYDDRGNLILTIYPDLTEERMFYDLENRRVAFKDRRGFTTYFVYDELGRMTDTINPDATTPDPASLDLSDSRNLLSNAELADNPTASTVYDEIGRVVVSIDERSNATTFAYDPECGCSGRRANVTNALSQTTSFAYSLNGNQLSVTDANLHTTSFEYDDLNRPTKTIFHDNTFTETVYDELGRRVANIDQEGKRTEYVYDGLGRLITVKQPHPDTADTFIETHYGYDEVGNQISQTDAEGRTTYYQYDSLGRRTGRTLPEGQTETYTYFDDGTLKTRTDFNGHTTTYEYDKLNRMTASIADATHPSLTLSHAAARMDYVYNDAGQRVSALVSNQAQQTLDFTEWTYDERNRLATQLTARGNLTYAYDESNNLTGVTSSNTNGVELTYDYDVLNRLDKVFDAGASQPPLEHSYTYDLVGNLDTITYANGVVHDWDYNSLNRLTNLTLANASGSLNSYTYTLRASGHRSRQTETSGRVVDYTYDNLYRLKSETISSDPYAVDGSSSWTYDLVGNRLTQNSTVTNIAAQTETYSFNDWLDSHTYDSNGNTTASDGHTDEYDFMNRLVRRTKSDGGVIDITYDADGNRVTKTTAEGATHYLVDVNNLTGYAQVLEELDSTLTTERVYTYGLDLIAQHQLMPVLNPVGWETSYYLYDGLGTVRALADENGLISDAYTYDAWGNLINLQGTTPNSYLFTGEQWDTNLGMYFLRARYMSPDMGRFHTLDTYEGRNHAPITLNKYLYANANPVTFIDPSGQFSIKNVAMTTAIVGTLTTLANITITGIFATRALGGGDGPSGMMVTAGLNPGARGVITGVNAHLLGMNGSSWGALSGEVGMDPTTIGKKNRGIGYTLSFSFIFGAKEPKDLSGVGFTATWPVSIVHLIPKALLMAYAGSPNNMKNVVDILIALKRGKRQGRHTGSFRNPNVVVQFGLSGAETSIMSFGVRSNSFSATAGFTSSFRKIGPIGNSGGVLNEMFSSYGSLLNQKNEFASDPYKMFGYF
ncbi:tandem-95 repeat protein [Rubellicoccus peritrichatus]|uniref:Ig-like domain-containing protein n=1 Tax=Rubellicoccus peritrichatus TaxID=3080537 RepID=A0AAQ3LA93_9BACT|nr:Ig-like domain-containing protein [Puniceicoccus sp. CR14]WOO40240.1 Ig-like domain-containing protein [Puniceicoccus sp. CR14]